MTKTNPRNATLPSLSHGCPDFDGEIRIAGPKRAARKRFPRLAAVLALAAVIPAASLGSEEAAGAFSLKSAREYAVAHSFDTRKSELDIEAARQKLKETLFGGFPQITSSLSYNNNLKLATSLIPNFFDGKPEEKIPVQFGTQHNATANIQVQQLIFNGSYIVGLQTSRLFRELAEQGHDRTRLTVRQTVTNTYGLILVARENERIVRATLANLEKTHSEIRELAREGFVAETDSDLVQIAVNQLRNAVQAVRAQVDIGFKLLKFQMGLDLETPIDLSDTLEDLLSQADVPAALARSFRLEDNIDWKLLVSQERMSEQALKNEKAKYWPTVSAFFTYQQNAFRDSFNFFSAGQRWFPLQILGISVSIPVFKSGSQSARVEQAVVAAEQARNSRLQAAQGLILQAEQARTGLALAGENYRVMKDNLALAEKIYEAVLAEYKEGVATSLELTQANDKVLQSQTSYIEALSGLLNAKTVLDRLHNSFEGK
jgi:outer membrane protein TolC